MSIELRSRLKRMSMIRNSVIHQNGIGSPFAY